MSLPTYIFTTLWKKYCISKIREESGIRVGSAFSPQGQNTWLTVTCALVSSLTGWAEQVVWRWVPADTGSCLRDIRASVSELSRPFLQGGEITFYLQFQASCSSRTKAGEETGVLCIYLFFFSFLIRKQQQQQKFHQSLFLSDCQKLSLG